MRLIPEYYQVTLVLRAEAFNLEDVTKVGDSLLALDIGFAAKPAAAVSDRKVVIYTIFDPRDISQFTEKLHIEFRGFGNDTSYVQTQAGAKNYKCERVTGYADIDECLNIMADDNYAAFLLCGMEAGKRNWSSGVHSPGFCEHR